MQIIQPSNVNVKSHGVALNALAVNKRSYPLYFYISTTKAIATACPATKAEISLTIATGSGLVLGDYFRIGEDLANLDDEVLRLKVWTTGDTVMIAERAQLGTEAEKHTATDLAFKQQDGFTNTQLGAGTAVIAESRAMWDLGDASLYQCTLELILACDQDYSAKSITLYYAFSGEGDIPMGASTLEARLTNVVNSLVGTFPNNAILNYITEQFTPSARYMYIWVVGHADLDDAQTTAKILLNTV